MGYFTVKNIEALRQFLRESEIHDGEFTQAQYDQRNKTFDVHIENTVWNASVAMKLSGIEKFVAVSDFAWGNNEAIIGLAELSGEEALPPEIKDSDRKEILCFLWEMFSGNRLYIVCKSLEVQ